MNFSTWKHVGTFCYNFPSLLSLEVNGRMEGVKKLYHDFAVMVSFAGVAMNFAPLYHFYLSTGVICSHSSETIFSVSPV